MKEPSFPIKAVIWFLVLVGFIVLLALPIHAQTRADLALLFTETNEHIAYQPSPDPRSARGPEEVIKSHYGNCLEKALVFLYLTEHFFPNAYLEIRGYDNGPGTIGHATAVVNGVEYDLTGGLKGNHYKRVQTFTYFKALRLYTPASRKESIID